VRWWSSGWDRSQGGGGVQILQFKIRVEKDTSMGVLVSMIITFPKCQKQHKVDESRIPAGGVMAKCNDCSHRFKIERPSKEQIKCPSCGHTQPKGLKCTSCGVIFAKFKSRVLRPRNMVNKGVSKPWYKKKISPWYLIAPLFIVVFALEVFSGYMSRMDTSSDRSLSRIKEDKARETITREDFGDNFYLRLAFNHNKKLIKKQMRAPSTAKFPGLFESKDHVTYLGDKRYQIRSYVDAQNAYGAMIRQNYTSVVRMGSNSNHWILEEARFY